MNKVCTISQCEKVTVCVASHFTRVISSVDTIVHSYSIIPPVLFGDNRSVTLAPHNASYPKLEVHLKNASIPFAKEALAHNWRKPCRVKTDSSAISFMMPQDFARMALPAEFNESGELFLAPPEFVEELELRERKFMEIREKIRGAKFSREVE